MDSFTAALATLIEGFEGFKSAPYQDQHGVWTIGFGHTDGVTKDSPSISKDQAVTLLLADMQDATDAVDDFLEVDVNDDQMAGSCLHRLQRGHQGARRPSRRIPE
jgi:lysozyme